MVNIQTLSFYAAIFFTVVGALLGLMGVWIPEFWRNDTTWKLLVTNFIFAGTSIVVAAITRFLSS